MLLIPKPYRREELARKLRTALGRAKHAQSPASATASQLAPQQQGNSAPARKKAAAVLFVEDDALVRLSAVDFLRDAGFTVIEAGDGPAALTLMDE